MQERAEKAATIKDVAAETNLAISTISKYLNNGPVKAENKAKIETAIKKLNYRPNVNARGVRSAKTYMVGLMTNYTDSHYFAKIFGEIERILKEHNYSVVFVSHKDNQEKTREMSRFLADKQVDGVILVPLADKESFEPILDAGIPLVTLDRKIKEVDCVQSKSTLGTYEAVEYMIQKGHRHIGIITGTAKKCGGCIEGNERLKGFYRALEDYALPVREDWIIEGDFEKDSGYEGMKQLWQRKAHPTALFISNYYMTLGAMGAIRELNIRIPEELSVAVFDDLEFSRIVRPKLTAVKQNMEEIARSATCLLLDRMSRKDKRPHQTIRIPTEFIVRESVQERFE